MLHVIMVRENILPVKSKYTLKKKKKRIQVFYGVHSALPLMYKLVSRNTKKDRNMERVCELFNCELKLLLLLKPKKKLMLIV